MLPCVHGRGAAPLSPTQLYIPTTLSCTPCPGLLPPAGVVKRYHVECLQESNALTVNTDTSGYDTYMVAQSPELSK